MIEYVYSIVSMAIIVGIVLIICPDGEGIKRHVKLISSLCLLCVMISPFSSFINRIQEFSKSIDDVAIDYDSRQDELYNKYRVTYKKYLEGGYGKDISIAIKNSISKKFEIKSENIRIMLIWDETTSDSIKPIKKITVILSNESIFKNPNKIREFVTDLFECECEIAIE